VRADEVLDEDEHGGAPAVGVPVELVGEMAVRDDPTESESELPLNLEKKPSLELVRVDGWEGISSRGETAHGGARADGGCIALRAGVERAGGIDSGQGGSGRSSPP